MHFSVYIWRKTNLYNKQSTWKSSTNWSRYAFINELVIDTLKIANNTKSLQLRPWTTIITVVICCDCYKTKTINNTKLLCVCACLGLQIGYFRTAGPYMVHSDYPLLKRPYCLFSPSRHTSAPPREYINSFAAPSGLLPPTVLWHPNWPPSTWRYLRGDEDTQADLDTTGISQLLWNLLARIANIFRHAFVCAPSWGIRSFYHLDILIPTLSELMTPGSTYAELPTYVATDAQSP